MRVINIDQIINAYNASLHGTVNDKQFYDELSKLCRKPFNLEAAAKKILQVLHCVRFSQSDTRTQISDNNRRKLNASSCFQNIVDAFLNAIYEAANYLLNTRLAKNGIKANSTIYERTCFKILHSVCKNLSIAAARHQLPMFVNQVIRRRCEYDTLAIYNAI